MICRNCGSDKTAMNHTRGYTYPRWTKGLCANCYARSGYDPIKQKKKNDLKNPRLLWFKGRFILLKERILRGFCELCGNNILDLSCILTHTHHWRYNDNNPLAHTIEVCPECHGRIESNKNGNKKFGS